MLRRCLRAIRREDDGQDLIEYTLLLAFLALASAGVFMQLGATSASVWGGANTTIGQAGATATGVSSNSTTAGGGNTGDSGRDHDHRH